MVNRKFAACTLLVLFLGGRFAASVLVGAFTATDAPIDFNIPAPLENTDVVFDQPFLHDLNQAGLFIGAGGVDGTRLVNFAHVICDSRDGGESPDQQYQRAIMAGIPAQDVHEFVRISVKNYCPGNGGR
jgi:hypothetical protein